MRDHESAKQRAYKTIKVRNNESAKQRKGDAKKRDCETTNVRLRKKQKAMRTSERAM